jgi:3-oxoacyl-ACP reductase-like protein
MSNQPQQPARGGAAAPANAAPANAAPANAAASSTSNASYRLPSTLCMNHAIKLAIVEDKPIMLDYWTASLDKSVVIGVGENKEKLLVKSEDEYTSTIAKIFKVETEYIIMTENSIYIVSNDIPTKRIN